MPCEGLLPAESPVTDHIQKFIRKCIGLIIVGSVKVKFLSYRYRADYQFKGTKLLSQTSRFIKFGLGATLEKL